MDAMKDRTSLAHGHVLHPSIPELLDDLHRPVAIVVVEVQDGDPLHTTLGLQHARRHHEAVEGAVAAAAREARVVKPGARRRRHATRRQDPPRSGQHRAGGVGQRSCHRETLVAEAVLAIAIEHVVHEVGIVRGGQLLPGRRLGRDEVQVDACLPPRLHAVTWLGGAG